MGNVLNGVRLKEFVPCLQAFSVVQHYLSCDSAAILFQPKASGEGEEQVAAFRGKAGPSHAVDHSTQSLSGLP